MPRNRDQLVKPTDEELQRIKATTEQFMGSAPTRMTERMFDLWLTEQRMAAERRATARLTRATWVLAIMTLALVVATCVLVYVTAVQRDGSGWSGGDPVTFSGSREGSTQ